MYIAVYSGVPSTPEEIRRSGIRLGPAREGTPDDARDSLPG